MFAGSVGVALEVGIESHPHQRVCSVKPLVKVVSTLASKLSQISGSPKSSAAYRVP